MSENEELEIVSADAIGAIERAQVDVQVATARKYPRQLSTVKAKMLSFATLDEETAAGCFYTLPARKGGDGKSLQGPSVRLAEIALASYQHIKAGARVVSDDGKFITAQGVVHDLENNVAITMEVKRRVTTKDGRRYSDDMIATTGNAACSIALRNAAFRVVPRALITPVYDAARKVAVGDVKSLTAKRAKVIERLKAAGATDERILAAVGASKVEDIDLARLETLIGLGTALKEGSTTLEEAFPEIEKSEPIPTFKPKVEAKPEPKPEPPVAPALSDPAARLLAILTSEGCEFSTLKFICEDPAQGVSAWNHVTRDCEGVIDMKLENIEQLLGKEKNLRTFIRTAKEAGK